MILKYFEDNCFMYIETCEWIYNHEVIDGF